MNDQEFIDFWNNITWPEVKPVVYRLYLDDQDRPVFYSHEDQPGKYVEVTPEQFAQQDLQVRVVNGVLKPRPQPVPPKLVPSDRGTPCAPTDVSIVVSEHEPHQRWKLKHYEQD